MKGVGVGCGGPQEDTFVSYPCCLKGFVRCYRHFIPQYEDRTLVLIQYVFGDSGIRSGATKFAAVELGNDGDL